MLSKSILGAGKVKCAECTFFDGKGCRMFIHFYLCKPIESNPLTNYTIGCPRHEEFNMWNKRINTWGW